MAQLRDAKTSQILLEGTPLEVALVADEIGRDEVLFDDVGEGFKADVVIASLDASIEGLEAASKDKRIPQDQRDSAGESLKREKNRREDAAKKVAGVRAAMERLR